MANGNGLAAGEDNPQTGIRERRLSAVLSKLNGSKPYSRSHARAPGAVFGVP